MRNATERLGWGSCQAMEAASADSDSWTRCELSRRWGAAKQEDHYRRPSADFAVPTGLASNRRSLTRPHVSPPAPAIQQNQLQVQPQVLPAAPVPPSMRHVPPPIEYHPPLDYRSATSLSGSTDAFCQPISRFCCFQSTSISTPKAKVAVAVTTAMADAARLTGVSFPVAIFSPFSPSLVLDLDMLDSSS